MEQSLKDVLERLGLRQAELAKLLDVSARTVSLWATGETPLPGPVAAYLRVLRSAGAEVLASELRRLEGRDKMFNEGIYGVSYKGENMGLLDGDSGLAVLRNGKILGSDRWGGVFMGRYEYDPVREHNRVHVRMQIRPRASSSPASPPVPPELSSTLWGHSSGRRRWPPRWSRSPDGRSRSSSPISRRSPTEAIRG